MRHIGPVATMVIILGLPLWGWADEPLPTGTCAIADLEDGTTFPVPCTSPLIKTQSCYQRMREVMKAMDKFRPVSWVDKNGNLTMTPIHDNAKIYQDVDLQWHATMKDCVEWK